MGRAPRSLLHLNTWCSKSISLWKLRRCDNDVGFIRRWAEHGFGEHDFKNRTQWVFCSPSSGENLVSSLSLLFICQGELTEFIFSWNWVSALFQNSTLETVSRLFTKLTPRSDFVSISDISQQRLFWGNLRATFSGLLARKLVFNDNLEFFCLGICCTGALESSYGLSLKTLSFLDPYERKVRGVSA